jgi:hypothetical protein
MFQKIVLTCLRATCCLVIFAGSAQADLNLADGTATGQWYNPQRDGEGFFVEIIGSSGNQQIGIAMYSYDTEGKQLWLVGNVPLENGDIGATIPVFLIEGPVWGTGYDPADRDTTQFGNIVARFPTCDTALFNVQSNVQGLESGTYSEVRLTEISGMDCTDPLPEPPPGNGNVTSGLWTGPGVCFFVNTEGTRIVESDLCDGKSFEAEVVGVEIDIDGNQDVDDCNANVATDAPCEIFYDGAAASATCVNEFGGFGDIYFYSATSASVSVIEGQDLDGRMCVGSTSATPAQ